MTKMRIRVIKDGCMPVRAEKGDWYDLTAAEDTWVQHPEFSEKPTMIPLGVAMEIPEGYSAIVLPRSSTPKNHRIWMANSAGVIDCAYNGPNDQWMFPAWACDRYGNIVRAGSRIAQFTLIRNSEIDFEESDLSDNDDRGGFGSTGV